MKNTFIRIIIETLYTKNTLNTSLLLIFCVFYFAFIIVHLQLCIIWREPYYYIFDDFCYALS